MSAFAQKSFASSRYLAVRPTYPSSLYSYVKSYWLQHSGVAHTSGNYESTLMDLGCGPGQATSELINYFDNVIGVDQSEPMIAKARDQVKPGQRLSYAIGSDKNFDSLVKPESLDVLTVAQAVHWFKFPEFWNKAYKVLKPQGTIALWGYVDCEFVGLPKASKEYLELFYGNDTLGPYWEQPGRNILRHLLDDIQFPADKFSNIERYRNGLTSPDPKSPLQLEKQVTIGAVSEYFKSSSSYYKWKVENAEKKDIVDEYIDRIKKDEGLTDESEVRLRWSTIVLLATKK